MLLVNFMKSLVVKDQVQRLRYFHKELCYVCVGVLERELRSFAIFRQDVRRSSAGVRVRNYCLVTGCSRGVLGRFRMSRVQVRELLRLSYMCGFSGGSW